MCLKSIPLAYQIDFFCIYIYICTLDPTQIVTCAILLMRNRTVRFVPSFQHFDTFRSLPPCPRTSGLILISLPFLLHLTTTRNNAQQCTKFTSSICTLNRHMNRTRTLFKLEYLTMLILSIANNLRPSKNATRR